MYNHGETIQQKQLFVDKAGHEPESLREYRHTRQYITGVMLLQLSPITKRPLLTDSSWTDQLVYASRHPCLTYLDICYQILPGLTNLFMLHDIRA